MSSVNIFHQYLDMGGWDYPINGCFPSHSVTYKPLVRDFQLQDT